MVGRKGTIGKVHYVCSDFWAHDTSLYVIDFHGNIPKFVFYLSDYLGLAKYGTKSGSPSLNRNDIHPLNVASPQPNEQDEIVRILENAELHIAGLKSSIGKLKRLKTGLMQDLLTGKKRVTNLIKKETVAV